MPGPMTPESTAAAGLLEIEKICEPFNRRPPVKLGIDKPPTSLVIPGTDCGNEYAVLRAKMLRPTFRQFGKNTGTLDERIGGFRSGGIEPVDAIYLAVMTLVRESMNHARESDPEFAQAKLEYDLMHLPERTYSLGAKDAMSEMRMFIGHGASVMVAAQEGAVQTYRAQVDPDASEEDLGALLPRSTQKMFSSLARVPGQFAVLVEKALSSNLRLIGNGTQTYMRLLFDPDRLQLQERKDGFVLDCRMSIRKAIEKMRYDRTEEYHACLAGLVRMGNGDPAQKAPTVFGYMEDLTAGLLKKHWIPEIAGKK